MCVVLANESGTIAQYRSGLVHGKKSGALSIPVESGLFLLLCLSHMQLCSILRNHSWQYQGTICGAWD